MSGSGKSSLVGGVLATHGADHPLVTRVVQVDQKPIGRTPRSNLATYTGLFDAVRQAFAATDAARERGWGAGRFSFNVAGGRCEVCQGEGSVSVELLFLPAAGRRARSATAPGTTPRRSRSAGTARASPTSSG